jgi:hypothetical protein
MSEQQRQKVEFAVRKFLKRVIRNGGTLPNGKHPVIDSEVYRLISVELSRQFNASQAEKLSVDEICDRVMPLINSRPEGQRFGQDRLWGQTVEFNNEHTVDETILV